MLLLIVRRLLAFALVSSVVLLGSGQPAAEAASVDTGWVRTNVHVDMGIDVEIGDKGVSPDFDCALSFRVVQFAGVNTYYLSSGGKCSDGPDASPGWCTAGEMGCTTFEATVTGLGCDLPSFTPAITSSSGTVSVSFVIGPYQVTDPGNCEPDQACVTITGDSLNPLPDGPVSGSGCAPLALDAPDVTGSEGECEFGNPTAASGGPLTNIDLNYSDHALGSQNSDGVAFEYSAYRYGEADALGVTGTDWIIYSVRRFGGGVNWNLDPGPVGSRTIGVPSPGVPSVTDLSGIADYSFGSHLVTGGKPNWAPYAAEPPGPVAELIGVGLVHKSMWPQWNNGPWYTSDTAVPLVAPVQTNKFYGRNDPALCSFYFGDKFWDLADTDVDDPTGTLSGPGDEPPLPPDPDDPPDDPPSNCDGIIDGFLCAAGWLRAIWNRLGDVVQWLGNIVTAIGSMAASVASAVGSAITAAFEALLDGLAALFVPEDGFLDGVFLDIKHAWKDSGPGSFIGSFSEMGVTMPGSSCGGIPVAFAVSGVAVDFNIGEACSGPSAGAAATVKLVVSASLVLFGGLASVRAIGSGFGWSPGIGRGPQ